MFVNHIDSERLVKDILQGYRQEAEDYRQLKGLQRGPSTGVKIGLALLGIISLLAAGQFFIF